MSQQQIKKVIDRMVEDAIRRILPTVMNEVLIKAIAGSGVMNEQRRAVPAARPVPPPQKRAPVRSSGGLRDLLDEGAGAEFYGDPSSREEEEYEIVERPEPPPIARRIQSLPPELQQLAEGMRFEDDDGIGEVWGQEHDSDGPAAFATPDGPDPLKVAKSAGLDFSRMAGVIRETAPKVPKMSGKDAADRQQFEEARLARQRELLNRKP